MNSLIIRLDANATDTATTDSYGGGKKNADWARRMELFLGIIKDKIISKSGYFSVITSLRGSHDYLCFAV
jgi:hypothetical protein